MTDVTAAARWASGWPRPAAATEWRRRALALILAWLFHDAGLLRVEMTTTPDNEVLPRLARRAGFTQEGILRARNFERGQRVDIVWFGLLREEWNPEALR